MNPPGLLARSMLASVLVAAVASVATAVLTADAVRMDAEREQVRVADVDDAIVDRLEAYGRAHPDWSGAGPLLAEIAASSDRLIVLTDVAGAPVASSAGPASEAEHGGDPTALLDPMAAVLGAATREVPTSYDALALPPALLSARPGAAQLRAAVRAEDRLVGACLEDDPDQEAVGRLPGSVLVLTTCRDLRGATVGDGIVALQNAVALGERDCLSRRGVAARVVRFLPAEGGAAPEVLTVHVPVATGTAVPEATTRAWEDCATAVLTRELRPRVAPNAVLYVSDIREVQRGLVDRVGGGRIVVALLVILAVAGVASLLASRRVLRPVRRLTAATQEMAAGHLEAQVPVSGNDEVARLGRSFNEMAQALADADRQRRRMVSDVAHELRTPLSNVRGYLEAGHEGVLDRDDAWTASLLEEVAVLQHVVDDLAVLAEADAGRLRLHRTEADVVATVDAALLAHRATAAAESVELARTGVTVAVLRHDPVRVRQVVSNLVANAIRHSPADGTVTVDVQVAGEGSERGVVIEVGDEGDGIAPDDLLRVFERFYRADPSRTRATGGSGLGLAIVQQLVEAHGGMVAARNRADRGAVFTVWLPAGPAE